MRAAACLALPVLAAAWLGTATAAEAGSLAVPVQYTKLENGLKVVLSPDPSAATAVVAVYYHIGFRIEPKDRTGFAHLFEHMMFQGSANLGKRARDRPFAPGLDSPVRDEHAARRLLLVAHHVEHPRGEGLHLLAGIEHQRGPR